MQKRPGPAPSRTDKRATFDGAEPDNEIPRVASKDLFGTAKELILDHAGDEYRLRQTRNGRLILTK